jgi:alkanesulfonate monooxygenase SsuD/methylene tetrahydromethanopterin reductase-like flavin-dependent oxidoreductase (luciferase family)
VRDAATLVEHLTPAERATVDDALARPIVGSAQTVHAGLLDLIDRTGTDELMLTSQVAEPGMRLRGLDQIAHAFDLSPASVA